jgi:hypothetical protein
VYIPATVAEELNTLVQFGYSVSFLEERQTYIIQKATDDANRTFAQQNFLV